MAFDDPEEYEQELLKCYMVLQFASKLSIEEIHDAQLRAESIGPFLDPTSWIRNGDKLREDKEVVEAVRAMLRRIGPDIVKRFQAA